VLIRNGDWIVKGLKESKELFILAKNVLLCLHVKYFFLFLVPGIRRCVMRIVLVAPPTSIYPERNVAGIPDYVIVGLRVWVDESMAAIVGQEALLYDERSNHHSVEEPLLWVVND